jgi:hypothetical protein
MWGRENTNVEMREMWGRENTNVEMRGMWGRGIISANSSEQNTRAIYKSRDTERIQSLDPKDGLDPIESGDIPVGYSALSNTLSVWRQIKCSEATEIVWIKERTPVNKVQKSICSIILEKPHDIAPVRLAIPQLPRR